MSIESKVQSLITAANSVTGESRTDLTEAVQDLKDGYDGGGLPSGYTAIDWIETTGMQYIITDYIPNAYTQVSAKYRLKEMPSNYYAILFGVDGGTTTSVFYQLWEYGTSRMYFRKYWESGNAYLLQTDSNNSINTDHNVEFGYPSSVVVDGGVTWGNNGNCYNFVNTNNNAMALFASNANGTIKNYSGKWRLYRLICKNYQTGDIEAHYIPCIRNSDSEAGLYDLVGKQFYTNQGTGDFIVPSA